MDNIDRNVTADAPPASPPVGPKPVASARARGRRGRSVSVWLARLVLVLCLLAGLYFSVFPSGRAAVRAVAILPAVLSAAQPAWEAPVAEPFTHTQRTVASPAGAVSLDIYAPVPGAPPIPGTREGILFLPGVGDQRKDAQLINFSEALARAGVVIIDMTTPTLIANRLDAGDEEAVIRAFDVLRHWPGVGANRVGLLGFSAGGPLMCFAAADPRIRDNVAFVALFGGYFDATTLLQTIGRRALTENGQTQPWHPMPYPLQVLADTLAPYLPGGDGQLLTGAFAPTGKESLSPAQIAQLAPSSAAAYHLLAGDEPARVDANLAALSPQVRALLLSLSPSRIVGQIRAPIYLLHDRSDQFVPVSESLAFAATLARLHHAYHFAEVGVFQHVEVRADLALSQMLGDGQTLLRLLSEVMQPGS